MADQNPTVVDNDTGEVVEQKATSLVVPGTLTPVCWIPPEDLTFSDWRNIGVILSAMDGSVHWWIGDWLNYGEGKWNEKCAQVVDQTNFGYDTVRADSWVANKIEPVRRRTELSWSHHREVASLPPLEQDTWLQLAERKNWSKTKLRAQIKKNGKENPPPENGNDRNSVLFINHAIYCKVYYIECQHRDQISLDDGIYCHWCQGWVDGVEVGDFTVGLLDDGQILVDGGGYVAEVGEL